MKPNIARNFSCTVHGVTDMDKIKSSCDNETIDLFVKDSQLHSFPHVFEYFTKLQSIDLSNSGIQHIDSTTFDGAIHLTSLDMDGSNIQTLQNHLFSHANNLTSFDMGNSSIVQVEKHAFHGLSNLKRLDLSNNKIVALDADIFQPLSLLETIRLTNNKIEIIDVDTFKNNVHLRWAYLSSNKIFSVDANAFIHCKLISLDLGYNQLTDLDMTTMKYLKTLIVANNKLNILKVPPVIREVHAENNSIAVISSEERSELVGLYLSSNYFTNLLNLTNFKKLQFLDLSNNHFRNIEFSNLKSLDQLKELKLTGNKLSEIKVDDVVTNLPNLSIIELSTKHWSDAYIKQLENDLKNHTIELGQDRNVIPDDDDHQNTTTVRPNTVPTTMNPPIPTQTPNTGDIERRLDEIGRQLRDLENRLSANQAANSRKIDDGFNDVRIYVEDKMKQANEDHSAKYDATMSTFKAYEALVIIMFVSALSFILYKVVVYAKDMLNGMRYRRAQSRDPIFSEQDL